LNGKEIPSQRGKGYVRVVGDANKMGIWQSDRSLERYSAWKTGQRL